MHYNKLIYITVSLLFCSFSTSWAQENTIFGLSMHGQPKYDANATHLDYANADAPKGGKIKIAAIGTFDTLNPYSIKGKAAMGLNLAYDQLMARVWDEPFTMYPLIAERIEIPEDRSSITVHINPKARFHDGSPITADDVIFSFETLKEQGRPNMRQIYGLVDQVVRRDPLTVYFHFGEGYDRETVMILTLMPVLSKAYWQDRTFDQTTLESPLLNGPYRIKDFDAGRYITYERVPNYWAADLLTNVGHHNFDEITYEYYRDDSVSFEAFASGQTDLRRESDLRKWSDAYDFPAITNGEIIKEALPHNRPEKTRGFIFNTRRPLFDDIRVREALTLLFDRYQLNKTLFNHEKKFITSYFPNSEFEALTFVTAPETVPIDMRAQMRSASKLLKESGWSVENGKQTKNGETLSFEVLLQHPEDEKIALHFQQNLKRLGIEIQIRVADSAGFIRRLQAYDYDIVLHHWQSSLSPGTEQMLYWGCEAAGQQGRFNYAGICDPEIDRLAAQVAQTASRGELVETMRALDAKLLAGHYIIPLFYIGKDFVAYKTTIKRPEITPLYGMVTETWWTQTDGDNP
ncbi:MAG: ABC transporter substrate-binding protein [Rhodospirillales bacterium]|nr:ABC transporter substrate-binding protein [Alphaproteobacteria bacterium]MCB9981764.1 ABC transporter substrate-binding protein [Rhodospirillales bacterium]